MTTLSVTVTCQDIARNDRKCSEIFKKSTTIVKRMKANETRVAQGSTCAETTGLKPRRAMPIMVGRTTRAKILSMVGPTGSAISSPCPVKTSNPKAIISGAVNTTIIPLMAVRTMDNAMSPRARKLKKFDVAPPGQQLNIIRPMATGVGGWNNQISANAPIGRSNTWHNKPTNTSIGALRILSKCRSSSLSPMVNMMTISAVVPMVEMLTPNALISNN